MGGIIRGVALAACLLFWLWYDNWRGALKTAEIDAFSAGYAASGHHPPKHFGSLIAVPMMAVVLWHRCEAGASRLHFWHVRCQ